MVWICGILFKIWLVTFTFFKCIFRKLSVGNIVRNSLAKLAKTYYQATEYHRSLLLFGSLSRAWVLSLFLLCVNARIQVLLWRDTKIYFKEGEKRREKATVCIGWLVGEMETRWLSRHSGIIWNFYFLLKQWIFQCLLLE